MSNFVKVEQVSLGDSVLAQFFELIRTGVYKAGDKLPGERELCAALQVSRPVLREVLSVLRHMGYVEPIQGDGTYISHQPLTPAVNSLRFNIATEQIRLLEVWETRNLLETELAALTAKRGGDIEIEHINKVFRQYKSLVEENADQNLVNNASSLFHETIYMAAHNDTLSYLLGALKDLLSQSRERTGWVEGSNERSVKEHALIAQAITNRDEDAAREAMRQHLQSVKSDLSNSLEHDDLEKL